VSACPRGGGRDRRFTGEIAAPQPQRDFLLDSRAKNRVTWEIVEYYEYVDRLEPV